MIELNLEGGRTRAEALASYLDKLDTELDYESNRRLNGDGTYVGYKTLRDFYKGRQWSFKAEENQTQRMYNYCFIVVESMTAFMAAEEPDNTHEPRDITDELQVILSEQVTKFLKLVHDQNKFHIQFQRGVRVASLTGDCFILGPFWNPVDEQITYRMVERPELVKPIWATDDYTSLQGYLVEYRMDMNRAKSLFKDELAEKGIILVEDNQLKAGEQNDETQTNQPMVVVSEYWDDYEHLTRINGKIIKHWEHDFGFVPGQYLPNIHLPGETRGTSDLENVLDPQQEYNLAASSEKDIMDAVGVPLLWGKELEGLSEIKTGRGTVFSLPEDGELGAIQPSGSPSVIEGYTGRRKADIISIARLNDVVVSGGGNVTQLSGRAMSVIMQGINNSVNLRKPFWKNAIERLNANILVLAEKYVPGAKDIIQGNYKTTCFIPSAYMRSITDELNKLTHKIQSQRTTMKNVGIPSPSEEQKLIKTELEDPILNTELSRQPGGYIAIKQQQEAAANPPPPPPQPGQEGASPETMLNEGQNQGGEMPTPTPGQGATASPQGLVNQQTQQATGAPVMMPGEGDTYA